MHAMNELPTPTLPLSPVTLPRGSLAEFMSRNKLDTMIGCASIPMLHNGVVCGDAAASIWRQVRESHLAPIEHHVRGTRTSIPRTCP
jgi:putative hemolysin